jgi:hypothetical protein
VIFWAVAQNVLHLFSGWDNQLKMLMITVSRIVFNPLLYRLSYRARAGNCNTGETSDCPLWHQTTAHRGSRAGQIGGWAVGLMRKVRLVPLTHIE